MLGIVGTGGWEYREGFGNVEADDLEVSPPFSPGLETRDLLGT
jgi:hypothetical protein